MTWGRFASLAVWKSPKCSNWKPWHRFITWFPRSPGPCVRRWMLWGPWRPVFQGGASRVLRRSGPWRSFPNWKEIPAVSTAVRSAGSDTTGKARSTSPSARSFGPVTGWCIRWGRASWRIRIRRRNMRRPCTRLRASVWPSNAGRNPIRRGEIRLETARESCSSNGAP